METSGAAGRGMDALNTIAIPPYSQAEDVVEMLTKVTEGILDQEPAYRYGKMGLQVVEDLEEIMERPKGDLFPVDDDGNYLLYYLHPTAKPMLLPMHAEEMKRALAKAVRATWADIYDRTPAIQNKRGQANYSLLDDRVGLSGHEKENCGSFEMGFEE